MELVRFWYWLKKTKNDCEIRHWKAEVVDGEIIKADTWYQLDENGEFQEVKERGMTYQ